MKTFPPNRILSFLLITFQLCNCNKYEKSQITNIVKLTSPDKKYDAYLYNVESGMSFGSTVNALQIVKFQENPDFYNDSFFRVQNSRPFQIKWENKNLIIKTATDFGNSIEEQPIKTENKKYNDVNIKNLIYRYSSVTSLSEFAFDFFSEKNENLIFKNQSDSLVFKISNTQISLGSNYILVNNFEQNKFDKNKGLAFESYKLIPKNKSDFYKLEKYQPLKIIE